MNNTFAIKKNGVVMAWIEENLEKRTVKLTFSEECTGELRDVIIRQMATDKGLSLVQDS